MSQVKEAALSNKHLPSQLSDLPLAFAWLPTAPSAGKTLMQTWLDAVIEHNRSSLKKLLPTPKPSKQRSVEICRRLAFHYGYIGVEELSGPELHQKFQDGWAVLSAWAAITETVLVIRSSSADSKLAATIRQLQQANVGAEVATVADKVSPEMLKSFKARKHIVLLLDEVRHVVEQFAAGSSQSSWKHYRTDGLRMVFDLLPERPAKPKESLQPTSQPRDANAHDPGHNHQTIAITTPSLPANDQLSEPINITSQLNLHTLCMQAAQQLDQRPLVLRREFQQLMQTDRIIVDIHPGYGSSTALRHTVWAVMQQSLTDAVYVDFTHPQFQGRELNLPQWVVMTLCLPESNITAEARMVLEEEVRRALAAGWLKPYFDHADALPLSQLSELFDLLLQLPKWAVACDRKYTPPEIDFRRPPIERALFGTPNTSEMQAFVDACVSERQRPAARRMLRECLWLQSTWLGLSVLRTMLQEGHPNRSAVAERYVLQLAERNACQHPPQELLFGLGQLTLECLFWVEKQEQMVKTITIDQIPRRGDYPFLFGRRYLPDLVTDWTRIGIASFHADKSLLSFPYWDLIVTMAGMAYAEKYVARQISLNETPQRVWSLCLPSAVRHLENHRQFNAMDRLMKEMETICWFDRGRHKAERLTHLQWYAMDCVAALTATTRARYDQFVAQLTDILVHEIETRIHELGGVLARFVADVEASRAELDMLIERLTSLDPRKAIAIGQSLIVAHEGKKASVITEIAGRMVSPPRRRG